MCSLKHTPHFHRAAGKIKQHKKLYNLTEVTKFMSFVVMRTVHSKILKPKANKDPLQ